MATLSEIILEQEPLRIPEQDHLRILVPLLEQDRLHILGLRQEPEQVLIHGILPVHQLVFWITLEPVREHLLVFWIIPELVREHQHVYWHILERVIMQGTLLETTLEYVQRLLPILAHVPLSEHILGIVMLSELVQDKHTLGITQEPPILTLADQLKMSKLT